MNSSFKISQGLGQRFLTNLATAIVPLAVLAIGSSQAFASPIPFLAGGQFNLGNFSVAVNGSPTVGCIDFYNVAQGCGTNALVTLNSPSDPIFGVVGVTTGTMKDLGPGAVPIPQSASLLLNGFTFDLLQLVQPTPTPGGCPPAATPGSCSIAQSPFVFSQTSITPQNPTNSVDVSLTELLCGFVTGTTGGTETSTSCSAGTVYAATFTSHFVGTINSSGLNATVANLIALIQGGTIVTDSVSANFAPIPVAGTPEPMSLILLGSGLAGISLLGRRFRRS